MGMSWGEKTELKEEILEEQTAERATIKREKRELAELVAGYESSKKIAQAELDTRVTIFENSKATEESKKALEEAVKALEQSNKDEAYREKVVDLNIRERLLVGRESELSNTLTRSDVIWEHAVEMARSEERVNGSADLLAARAEIATHKADSKAKDAIITSLEAQITRLAEHTDVLVGKLTQVDLKGITIHVEAAKPVDKDNSGNKEQKN